MNKPTISEAAKISGFSVATISRVINNSPNVTDKTKKDVNKVLTNIGYYETKKTKENNSKKNLIGVIVTNVSAIGISAYIKGIIEVANLYNYNVIINESKNSIEKEEKIIKDMLICGVKGILYFPGTEDSGVCLNLLPKNFPIVIFERTSPKVPSDLVSVLIDHEYSGYLGTKYLINLGHKNIVIILGLYEEKHSVAQLQGLKGYKKALLEEGIEFKEELVINADCPSLLGATKSINQFFAKKIPFSAIYGANDSLALSAIYALKEHNINIPEQISVLGNDDTELSEAMNLTSMDHRGLEVAHKATENLFSLIMDKKLIQRKLVSKASFVLRKTCSRSNGAIIID